jgi:hypothetical protein
MSVPSIRCHPERSRGGRRAFAHHYLREQRLCKA